MKKIKKSTIIILENYQYLTEYNWLQAQIK